MTNYVVTGGAGAVGSNLVRRLLQDQTAHVLVVDDLSSGYAWLLPQNPRLTFAARDINDIDAIAPGTDPGDLVVFHLAAFFANQNSVEHPDLDLYTNGQGTLAVLRWAEAHKAARVVYAAAGCSIVAHGDGEPIREDMLPSLHLSTPYQITKALGEYYCNYFQSRGLSTVRCRFFNSYGPGEVPGRYRNVIPNFIWAALHDQPLIITGTGDETRDFIFVEDLVTGLISASVVGAADGEAINLGTGVQTTIVDLARMIIRLCRSRSQIFFATRRSWDQSRHREAVIDKARTLLGCTSYMPVEMGLAVTIAWFCTHYGQIAAAIEKEPRV